MVVRIMRVLEFEKIWTNKIRFERHSSVVALNTSGITVRAAIGVLLMHALEYVVALQIVSPD